MNGVSLANQALITARFRVKKQENQSVQVYNLSPCPVSVCYLTELPDDMAQSVSSFLCHESLNNLYKTNKTVNKMLICDMQKALADKIKPYMTDDLIEKSNVKEIINKFKEPYPNSHLKDKNKLFEAAKDGDIKLIKLFINVQINLNYRNDIERILLLIMALYNKHEEIVKLLQEALTKPHINQYIKKFKVLFEIVMKCNKHKSCDLETLKLVQNQAMYRQYVSEMSLNGKLSV